MMTANVDRAALIKRQGSGARHDAPEAPAADLRTARRATAQVARLLNDMDDATLLAGRDTDPTSPAHVIARVTMDARRMSEFIAVAIASNGEVPPGLSWTATKQDVQQAALLPPHALRNLFDHTRAHLNVEWRDMTSQHWALRPQIAGQPVALSSFPSARAVLLGWAITQLKTRH